VLVQSPAEKCQSRGVTADCPGLCPRVHALLTLPSGVARQAAERWGALFQLFLQHSGQLHSVTLWGVADAYSWLNNWPVNGRTNYALLFDRQLQPTQSWQRLIEAAGGAQ
jgi:GH35 family endo-1,4-beta-xylanase